MHPDSGKSSGFLSKVMHLVRGNARTSAVAMADHDGLSAREVLNASMVRKRRNEAIRQHEFAQLRLLRQRHEAGDSGGAASAPKEDGLQSILGQETRSTETLQKIDAIEAQMSGQWWRGAPHSGTKAEPAGAAPTPHARPLAEPPLREEARVVPAVQAGSMDMPHPVADAGPAIAEGMTAPPAFRVFKPHPDLEEAAILFAHGDMEGARTRLLEQLVQVLSAEPRDEDKAAALWHAVLDVCRATGDEEAFEPLAIDYAEHFGRSAPLWYSVPARLGMPALQGEQPKRAHQRQFQWSCPAMLTVGALTALRVSQEEASQPWSLSWRRLTSIDEVALTAWIALVDGWSECEGQFVLSDAGRLLALLQAQTPVGDASVSAQWWVARMAVLRWMHRMEDYEQVALDYCITYEVSPPSWVAPACFCVVQEVGDADVSILQEASHCTQHAAQPVADAVAPPASRPGLVGVVLGDPQACLDALAAQAQPGQVLEIHCANLIRLDFVAAGSVLNWVAEMQAKGYVLRFTQVHQLVAVFFHVIGIHEHATVQASIA